MQVEPRATAPARSIALAVAALLGGCSPMPATTIEGPEAFHRHALRVDLASQVTAEEIARCFESSASLLPGSSVTTYPQSDSFVYRLRAGRFLFESIDLQAQADGTSRVVIEVTPDYKPGMREDFVVGRLAPLYQCAGTTITATWPSPARAG